MQTWQWITEGRASETEPMSWELSDKQSPEAPHPHPGRKWMGNRQPHHFSQMRWGWGGKGDWRGGEGHQILSCSRMIIPNIPGHRLVGRLGPIHPFSGDMKRRRGRGCSKQLLWPSPYLPVDDFMVGAKEAHFAQAAIDGNSTNGSWREASVIQFQWVSDWTDTLYF